MASHPGRSSSGRVDNEWQRPRPSFIQRVCRFLPDLSFIALHYLYFIVTCLIASVIFWGSSTPARSVSFVDSIYLTVSAMTEAGLNTVNLSKLNTWQQVILFLLIMMGSSIFVSSAIIEIRKKAFEIKLRELADRRQRRISEAARTAAIFSRAQRLESASTQGGASDQPHVPSSLQSPSKVKSSTAVREIEINVPELPTPGSSRNHTQSVDHFSTRASPAVEDLYRQGNKHRLSDTDVGTYSHGKHPRYSWPDLNAGGVNEGALTGDTENDLSDSSAVRHSKLHKYVSTVNGYLGRNSQFHQLTGKERRALGGVEYDALRILSYIVPIYFVLFQLFGAVGCGAWMQINQPQTAEENGLNPFWTGAFFAVSAFNNSGMAVLDANATVFQTSYYMLLTLSLLIVAGKTGFPPFLRLIFWTMRKCLPNNDEWQSLRLTMQFILDHPRRVYTDLFPSNATWWLVLSLFVFNGIDWIAFEVLNIGNPVTESIEPRFRALDGLFQAFAVRCGGFHVVNIPGLYPGTLVLYVLMMYLSAFPVTMAIRNTNVYEERSLGIFTEDSPLLASEDPVESTSDHDVPGASGRTLSETPILGQPRANRTTTTWSKQGFLRQQIKSQLSHDLQWLSLAVLFITIFETRHFLKDPVNFSVFNSIFEIVSAYGTVGVSIGVPWDDYSLSGAWHTGSKLVLCGVMLLGRHRGLPVAIDRAVLLPDHAQRWAEEEEDQTQRSERASSDPAIPQPEISRSSTLRSLLRNADGKAVNPFGSDVV